MTDSELEKYLAEQGFNNIKVIREQDRTRAARYRRREKRQDIVLAILILIFLGVLAWQMFGK